MPHSSRTNLKALAIAASFACGCFVPQPVLADQNRVIGLNNDGVKALNRANFPLAIEFFEKALKEDIKYSLAIENLAIAYNNFGKSVLQSKPTIALSYFYRSSLLNNENQATSANIKEALSRLKRKSTSYSDHIKLASEASKRADLTGAFVEYFEALKCKSGDEPARKKLFVIVDALEKKGVQPYAHFAKNRANRLFGISESVDVSKKEDNKQPDFSPVMHEIQRRIKRNWFPPRDSASRQTVVIFKIAKDGSAFDIKVDKTSGSESGDRAAINAIKDAAPFVISRPHSDWLPIDIQFTFDYNVFGRTIRARLAKDDFDNAPPDAEAMAELKRRDFAVQSMMYEYAQSFEKFGKFDSALALYEKLLYFRKFDQEKDQGEIASLNRSIKLVKLLIKASQTTEPQQLEPLVIDCLVHLESDSTLSHSTTSALRRRLVHWVFQRKADAVRLAETVASTPALSLPTKQSFIQNLHSDAAIDFYSERNAKSLGQMNDTYKKKLEDLQESIRICEAAFKFEREGNFSPALENYRKAYVLREKSIGANDADTLALKGDMARILVKQGKLKEAQLVYEETVSAFKKCGAADYRYTRFLESYGDALSQAKVEPLASQVYAQAIEAWKNSNAK